MISVSGIRGIVGEGLTPEIITKYASAFGTWANGGKIVIGRDSRVSGEMVRMAVVAGLLATGCRVIDIGIVSTPTTEIAVKNLKAYGGIAITASHNPVNWNALKLIGPKGLFLDQAQGNEVIELALKENILYQHWDRLGKIEYYDYAIQNHIDQILELEYLNVTQIKDRKFKVAVDCVNGAGGIFIPKLLQELGCDVVILNEEPHGIFPRNPEPVVENLGQLSNAVLEFKADIGLAVDPDVDRLAIVDENGQPIGEEYTLALATDFILSKQSGSVVINASTSMVIDDIAQKYGSTVFRTKIGEINVSTKMQEKNAVIGGEGNGGVILPEIHFGRDAATGIALILQHLCSTGKKVSELKQTLPQYAMIKTKIELSKVNADEVLQRITHKNNAQKVDKTDGVKLIYDHSWIHFRKSNTEPILRTIVEARTPQEAEALLSSFTSFFK
ncbi:phosphoglucosamine mutase [bacterium]|nr:phosphoglucosamine mutase [bacterium]